MDSHSRTCSGDAGVACSSRYGGRLLLPVCRQGTLDQMPLLQLHLLQPMQRSGSTDAQTGGEVQPNTALARWAYPPPE